MSLVMFFFPTLIWAEDNAFAFNLFELMQQKDADNIIISPTSLEQAIGMSANGAEANTLNEILSLTNDFSLAELNRRNQQDAEILNRYSDDTISHMSVANSVWHMPFVELYQTFKDSVTLRYNAYIDSTNFGTQEGIDKVNNWVSNRTNNLIKQVLDKPDDQLALTLINTVLFSGKWSKDIIADNYYQGPQPFLNADGSGTMVDMLQLVSYNYLPLYVEDDFAAVSLNFAQEVFQTKMPYQIFFIMPRDPQRLVPFTGQNWKNLLSNGTYQNVIVRVPKFDLSCSKDMLPTLREMGAFNTNSFPGISEMARYVDNILHFTRIKLDENGVEAAAATEIGYPCGSPGEESPLTNFIVDRPFFVAITAQGVDEPVFIGRINKIEGQACKAPAPVIFNAIDNVSTAASAKKFIRNGQVLINKNGVTYNTLGIIIE